MLDHKKLREARLELSEIEAGWTQGDVASKVGVTAQAYRNWEQGHHLPNQYHYNQLKIIFAERGFSISTVFNKVV